MHLINNKQKISFIILIILIITIISIAFYSFYTNNGLILMIDITIVMGGILPLSLYLFDYYKVYKCKICGLIEENRTNNSKFNYQEDICDNCYLCDKCHEEPKYKTYKYCYTCLKQLMIEHEEKERLKSLDNDLKKINYKNNSENTWHCNYCGLDNKFNNERCINCGSLRRIN